MEQKVDKTTPLIPRERVLVGTALHVDEDLACAKEFGFGVELQHFAMPPQLGQPWQAEAERLLPMVQGIRGPVGIHGPFIDTVHTSPDPAIQALTRQRYEESFELAAFLGARFVVLHSQYNTMLRLKDYPGAYHEASLRFWPELVEDAVDRGITIYVENMFDVSPDPIARVVSEINHPALRVCFDVSHAVIHGGLSIDTWLRALGPLIGHVHINDCDGKHDQHLALGDGNLELTEAIAKLEALGHQPTYTLETHTGARASAAFLGLAPL